jgi:hypothetical protein
MLVFRVLATIFVALSIITSLLKNILVFYDEGSQSIKRFGMFVFTNLYSVLWRAFVITAIWLI